MSPRRRPFAALLLPLVGAVVAGLLTTSADATSTPIGQSQRAGQPMSLPMGAVPADVTSPLHGPWGSYRDKRDEAYAAYARASGDDKAALGKIALRARVRWFGGWIPRSQVVDKIRYYIAAEQRGDSTKLVQLALFNLWPNGGEGARGKPIPQSDQDAYKAWVRTAAQAIGSSRVAVVLEPDLAVALKGWRPDVREAMTRYSAYVLSKLPNTTVYIDAGDADWLPADQAVAMLTAAGVSYVRGFALGATHYASGSANKAYGRDLVARLEAAGIPDKHFVIDTADNGRPFTWLQYYAEHPRGDFDNAEACGSIADTTCDTLGHPPTWRTADPEHVDGYLWFGRPWLYRQNSPFVLSRALQVARTTPY